MGCEAGIAKTETDDALQRWLAQEGLPLPPDLSDPDGRADDSFEEECWPSGWWILPMLAAAAPVWAMLGWWILG
jgi:hypothetical protein